MATAFDIVIAIEKVIQEGMLDAPAIVSYVQTLIEQFHTNSTADIDAMHVAALEAANAEAPEGAPPLDDPDLGVKASKAKSG